jgi:hypothetical protein
MSLGSLIEAYVSALGGVVGPLDIYGAVHALVVRDSASRWWEDET